MAAVHPQGFDSPLVHRAFAAAHYVQLLPPERLPLGVIRFHLRSASPGQVIDLALDVGMQTGYLSQMQVTDHTTGDSESVRLEAPRLAKQEDVDQLCNAASTKMAKYEKEGRGSWRVARLNYLLADGSRGIIAMPMAWPLPGLGEPEQPLLDAACVAAPSVTAVEPLLILPDGSLELRLSGFSLDYLADFLVALPPEEEWQFNPELASDAEPDFEIRVVANMERGVIDVVMINGRDLLEQKVSVAWAGMRLGDLPEEIVSEIVGYLERHDINEWRGTSNEWCERLSVKNLSPAHSRQSHHPSDGIRPV